MVNKGSCFFCGTAGSPERAKEPIVPARRANHSAGFPYHMYLLESRFSSRSRGVLLLVDQRCWVLLLEVMQAYITSTWSSPSLLLPAEFWESWLVLQVRYKVKPLSSHWWISVCWGEPYLFPFLWFWKKLRKQGHLHGIKAPASLWKSCARTENPDLSHVSLKMLWCC